jgi:hypothetical protein
VDWHTKFCTTRQRKNAERLTVVQITAPISWRGERKLPKGKARCFLAQITTDRVNSRDAIRAQECEEQLMERKKTKPPAASAVATASNNPTDHTPPSPVSLFYSYSHKDERYRIELEKHLSALKRHGLISEWHDRKISGGSEWRGKIDENLQKARIILLLISADFLHSDYCYDVELKQAMKRHEAGLARVVPVILRPCDWQSSPFGKFQALPKDGKPLNKWNPRDSGYLDIAIGLRRVVYELVGPDAASTHVVTPSAPAGKAAPNEKPSADEQLRVTITAAATATALPPYSTGEPIHLDIRLNVANIGTAPVFIVSANLIDARGQHSLGFSDICNETEPLQPGARRKSTYPLLDHSPFPRTPRSPRTPEALKLENLRYFKLLRFICQPGSIFQIETGRGTLLRFPAAEVCDEHFLGWPYIATPDDIVKQLGAKTLEEFEADERAAWQSVGARISSRLPAALSVEVKEFYYQDLAGDPMVVSACPRRYLAELVVTNQSERPISIKDISITVGPHRYAREEVASACRVEPGDFKELQESFPVDNDPALDSGDFALIIVPAVGNPVRVTGVFPVRASQL